jgi:hypothetical protein
MQEEISFGFPILTFLTFFPLLGALVVWGLKDHAQVAWPHSASPALKCSWPR